MKGFFTNRNQELHRQWKQLVDNGGEGYVETDLVLSHSMSILVNLWNLQLTLKHYVTIMKSNRWLAFKDGLQDSRCYKQNVCRQTRWSWQNQNMTTIRHTKLVQMTSGERTTTNKERGLIFHNSFLFLLQFKIEVPPTLYPTSSIPLSQFPKDLCRVRIFQKWWLCRQYFLKLAIHNYNYAFEVFSLLTASQPSEYFFLNCCPTVKCNINILKCFINKGLDQTEIFTLFSFWN